MKRKRESILILMQGVPDGKNRALYQRARELSDFFDLTLVTGPFSEVVPEIAESARIIRVFVPKLFQKGILFKIYYTLYIIFKLLPRTKLVLYTFQRNGFTAAGCLKLLKDRDVTWFTDMQHTPYYYWDYAAHPHLTTVKKVYYYATGLLYIFTGKVFLPKADRVFVMSYNYGEGFGSIMAKDFKVPLNRLSPIPNGVDLSLVRAYVVKRSKSSFSDNDIDVRCVYAGNVRLERMKDLLQLVTLFKKRGVRPLLYLCGRMNKQVQRFLHDQNVLEVKPLGFIPHGELLNLYNKVDVSLVLIDPLMRDHQFSHPGKLFEALAMGKLVLVSDLPSARKVVVDGKSAIVVDNKNLDEGVQRLCALLSDATRRSRMEENARESVRFLDWKMLNQTWLDDIKRTLSTWAGSSFE